MIGASAVMCGVAHRVLGGACEGLSQKGGTTLKRVIALLLAMGAIALVLASCGGKDQKAQTDEPQGQQLMKQNMMKGQELMQKAQGGQ